jgi:hypothetical protein
MNPEDRISAVNARMDQVLNGLKLASPEALEGCAALLHEACQMLAGISAEPSGTASESGTLSAAKQLRTKIRQARRLLENVYRFHTGWSRLLGSRTVGYLPGGQVAPLPRASRWCLRG